jgi:hypothetical protein
MIILRVARGRAYSSDTFATTAPTSHMTSTFVFAELDASQQQGQKSPPRPGRIRSAPKARQDEEIDNGQDMQFQDPEKLPVGVQASRVATGVSSHDFALEGGGEGDVRSRALLHPQHLRDTTRSGTSAFTSETSIVPMD